MSMVLNSAAITQWLIQMQYAIALYLLAALTFTLAWLCMRWETRGIRLPALIVGKERRSYLAPYYWPIVAYKYNDIMHQACAYGKVFKETTLDAMKQIEVVILPCWPNAPKTFDTGKYKRSSIYLMLVGLHALAAGSFIAWLESK